MTNPTSNYAWQMPTPTDLVTDLPADFEVFGQAVDNSLWNSGYGQAGKNKLHNGDFKINQRSFTSTTSDFQYPADRFANFRTAAAGSVTVSRETFTLGAAPVAGYEGTNFLQIVTVGQAAASDNARIQQQVESVRTFAGNTVTLSFWARATSGTPSVAAAVTQAFGTGGSPSANVDNIFGKTAITTSWARYSLTASIASISGKTIGTAGDDHLKVRFYVSAGTDFNTIASSLGVQNNTFQIWGMQLEYGSKMTPFQLAGGGAQQAELALCQRYYFRLTYASAANREGSGGNISTTQANINFTFPVTMRTIPTALEQSGTAGDYSVTTGGVHTVCSAVPNFGFATQSSATPGFTVASGLTTGTSAIFRNVNTSAFFGWSAEL
jgi:hypothetical protein